MTSDVAQDFTLLNPGGKEFTAESDGNGGTEIVLKNGEKASRTAKDDTITAGKSTPGAVFRTAADDSIRGRQGDDRIDGLAGHDALFWRLRHDQLAGGDGDDQVGGGTGSNKLSGNAGFDAFVFDTKLGEGTGKGNRRDLQLRQDQGLHDRQGPDPARQQDLQGAGRRGALSPDAFAIGKKAKSEDASTSSTRTAISATTRMARARCHPLRRRFRSCDRRDDFLVI